LSRPRLAAAAENPSYLVVDAARGRLFAVNEVDEHDGRPTGLVSAFAIDEPTGILTLLGRQPSEGAAPCHLTIALGGRHLLVASYNGGSIACLPIEAGGGLGPAASVRRHEGRGPIPGQQDRAHAHAVHLADGGRLAIAVDLGLDRLVLYTFDEAGGCLLDHEPAFVPTHAGAGPRHLAFHPSGGYLYVDNELDSTVTAYGYEEGGRFSELHTLPTLPAGFAGENTTAEVAVSPDGRHLYVSNRGHDSIATFQIHAETGRLSAAGHTPSGGRTPRHFALDASGRWLLAANQDTGGVVVFRRDTETGALTPSGAAIDVPRAVCVRFLR
jgi:6-phosphogluconolactonase